MQPKKEDKTSSSESQQYEAHLKEWEAARDVLKQFDDRIHDLRKYGFSFVTALLTAESLLIPAAAALAEKKAPIPEPTKATVLAVTISLIVGLRLIEKNYQLFQEATATRAKILERRLNLELTDTISDRLNEARPTRPKIWKFGLPSIGSYPEYVYYVLVGGVFLLGLFILNQDLLAWSILIAATIVALLVTGIVTKTDLHYKRGMIDWTINPIDCHQGDMVGITLTNLAATDIAFPEGQVWELQTQDGSPVPVQNAEKLITISDGGHYTWIWDTGHPKATPGIYRVVPFGRPPLRRTIRLREPETKS